jgi:hypothetical protein
MKNLFLTCCTILMLQQFGFTQEVVSSTFLRSYPLEYFTEDLEIIFAQNGVDLYRVNYTTTNLEGALDTASGLVCIPHIDGFSLPLVSYSHGTVGSRFDVPSYLSPEHTLPAIYSSAGTVCVTADYLGLGFNDGIHPYVHADSEASAGFDLIIAAESFLAQEMNINLNDQLFITGYSQGGHAAMALHRYIEQETDIDVSVAMPMSGPYSISTGMKDLLISDDEYAYVAYLVWTAISYQAAYGTIFPNNDITQFFKPAYTDIIQKFTNEEVDLFDMNTALIEALIANEGGSFPKKLIYDDIVNAILADDDHPVNIALRDNDVYDWAPRADTRLLYCQADDQVAFENSIIARDKMIENGAQQVTAIDLNPNFNHTECVTPAATNFVLYLLINGNPTSAVDIPEVTFNIFPNPTQNGFQITTAEYTSSFGLQIFSMSGSLKMQVDNLNTGDFVSTDLASGMYLVLINDKNGKCLAHQKVVIY